MNILKKFWKKTASLIRKNISNYKFMQIKYYKYWYIKSHSQRAGEIWRIAKKCLNLWKSYNLIKK
jgi:hypothetical protein